MVGIFNNERVGRTIRQIICLQDDSGCQSTGEVFTVTAARKMRKLAYGSRFYCAKTRNYRIAIAYEFRINKISNFSELHGRCPASVITVYRLISQ